MINSMTNSMFNPTSPMEKLDSQDTTSLNRRLKSLSLSTMFFQSKMAGTLISGVEKPEGGDRVSQSTTSQGKKVKWVPGAVIVGAGPSGLAVAALLKSKGIPSVVIERSDCIASLWQHRTYDRLRLTIPAVYCALPLMPFPTGLTHCPDRQEFVEYLEAYAKQFTINPVLNMNVESAVYDESVGMWRIKSVGVEGEVEYVCRWLVVATGELAEKVVPKIDGIMDFCGEKSHTADFKSGSVYRGKQVLVVGCGESGRDVCLDLNENNVNVSIVVRGGMMALEFQNMFARTSSAADIITKIEGGVIEMHPEIRRIRPHSVEFIDGKSKTFDSIIFATGYKINVSSWLQEKEMFSEEDGYPKSWRGALGLYAAGFTKRGLPGASEDAKQIAEHIGNSLKMTDTDLDPFEEPPGDVIAKPLRANSV